MTVNDAFKYARREGGKQHTNISLEKKMKSEGYSDEEISMVKEWLFNHGRRFKR